MSELVSVIMTTYNSINVIRKTLASVTGQDYPNIEIIAVDGGSTDGTVEVLREYGEKLKEDSHCTLHWFSGRDGGIYDAMNKAIDMASGQIIGICNDEFVGMDAISRLVSAMRQEGCLGVHADLVYADNGRVVRYWHMGRGKYLPSDTGKKHGGGYISIRSGWMPAHPTLYLDRKVYEAYGRYDVRYRSSADYEFMLRFLAPGSHMKADGTKCAPGDELPEVKLAYIPDVLISMYYGGTSNGGLKGYLRNACEARDALRANDVRGADLIILLRIFRTVRQFFPAGNGRIKTAGNRR